MSKPANSSVAIFTELNTHHVKEITEKEGNNDNTTEYSGEWNEPYC